MSESREQVEQLAHDTVTTDDPKTQPLVLLGGIGVIGLVVIVIALQALFLQLQRIEQQKKVMEVEVTDAKKLYLQQQAELQSYGWVDQEQQRVRIPISLAMELTANDITEDGAAAPAPTESP